MSEPKADKMLVLAGKRFLKADPLPPGIEASQGTEWWYDTQRPLDDPQQPYLVKQVEAGKDPNDYRPVADLRLLFTDQCEYYAVCPACYATFAHMQWSGSTRGSHDWRATAKTFLARHQRTKGWCEFCDPVFGNGGWIL